MRSVLGAPHRATQSDRIACAPQVLTQMKELRGRARAALASGLRNWQPHRLVFQPPLTISSHLPIPCGISLRQLTDDEKAADSRVAAAPPEKRHTTAGGALAAAAAAAATASAESAADAAASAPVGLGLQLSSDAPVAFGSERCAGSGGGGAYPACTSDKSASSSERLRSTSATATTTSCGSERSVGFAPSPREEGGAGGGGEGGERMARKRFSVMPGAGSLKPGAFLREKTMANFGRSTRDHRRLQKDSPHVEVLTLAPGSMHKMHSLHVLSPLMMKVWIELITP